MNVKFGNLEVKKGIANIYLMRDEEGSGQLTTGFFVIIGDNRLAYSTSQWNDDGSSDPQKLIDTLKEVHKKLVESGVILSVDLMTLDETQQLQREEIFNPIHEEFDFNGVAARYMKRFEENDPEWMIFSPVLTFNPEQRWGMAPYTAKNGLHFTHIYPSDK